MPDREKVIKGREHLDEIMDIATHLGYPDYGVVHDHCLALLELLKEQETEKKCCHDCEYYGACHDE